jgi:hypothetical protein
MLRIAAYYDNHSKHTNTLCGQHAEFLKQLLHLCVIYLRTISVAQSDKYIKDIAFWKFYTARGVTWYNARSVAWYTHVASPGIPHVTSSGIPYVASPGIPHVASPGITHVVSPGIPHVASPGTPHVASLGSWTSRKSVIPKRNRTFRKLDVSVFR